MILIQECWGLVPHITDVADRLAAEGFTVLAPDLYHGADHHRARRGRQADDGHEHRAAAGKDMSGAVDHLLGARLGRPATEVGVIGFCMGGGLALVLACLRPDAIGATVPFYGLIPWPDAQPDYSRLDAPGARPLRRPRTASSRPSWSTTLQAQLDSLGKEADLEVYPGVDHAFFNDTRPEVYDAEAAARAWVQTVGFLHTNLD